ncbi:hypothetical protein BD324DRAFT_632129 [Kockovaella imperatae]|uniref:Uncharacterized protein n=1 Tax=Kockovaella imperatae TaxID=4999 RepID=A0A1Y1UB54_9TREE|nr:hypothetical protein BD324DRAFT_632129 [Kockovaella imperatae]ORX35270.1 hypothetical protein BD324DRAFT_632129 [Kockovaella imperatae]
MFWMMWSVAVLLSSFLTVVVGQFTVATPPSLVQCQPVRISWSEEMLPTFWPLSREVKRTLQHSWLRDLTFLIHHSLGSSMLRLAPV